MRKLPALLVVALLTAGCTAGEDTPTPTPTPSVAQSGQITFQDLSAAPDINAMLPKRILDGEPLRVAISPSYPPAETYKNGDFSGYTVDIVRSMGKVMGTGVELVEVDFNHLLDGLGTDYDIVASSLTLTPRRLEKVNMITYLNVGSQLVVATKPKSALSPDFPCGARIGVLPGSSQITTIQEMSGECEDSDKKPILVTEGDNQSLIFQDIFQGNLDGSLVDATAARYAKTTSLGRLALFGKPTSAIAQGMAVSSQEQQLTVAVQAAIQHLIDNKYLETIMESYNLNDVTVSQSSINPRIS